MDTDPDHKNGGMEMKVQFFLLIIFVLAATACQPSTELVPTPRVEQEQATDVPAPTIPPPTPTPQPKLDELVMAAMAGWNSDQISPDQVELTLSYFSDDAVFTMVGFPPQMPAEFRGKEAIRASYESWMPLHPKLVVKIEAVDGNVVTATTSYWSDPTRAMEIAPLVGEDVYIFKDGKIISETWTLTEESQTQFTSAMATATAPTVSPEALAVSLDELVGIWKGYWSDRTPVYFEIKEGGRYRTFFPSGNLLSGGNEISKGNVSFENSMLIFLSVSGNDAAEACLKNPRAEYMVYVTKQGDKSIQLRFELVGEDNCVDREVYLNGSTLTAVNP
jgi:hypothetical protein